MLAGGEVTRLQGDWRTIARQDPTYDWARSGRRLAIRAGELVQNDPHAAALVEAVELGVLGADGLRLRSLYQADASQAVTDEEAATRAQIEASLRRARHGRSLDAGGQLTARELEAQLLRSEIIAGDGIAVRVWDPDRPGASHSTCWRVIDPLRVSNPQHAVNSDVLFEGFELNASGRPVAIHIRKRVIGSLLQTDANDWVRVPWYQADGTPNIIHTARLRRPGSIRGVSWFAPLLNLARHLSGTVEAFAVAKRVQACHPIVVKSMDPNQTAAAERSGALLGPNSTLEPGKFYFTGHDSDVVMPSWQFQGADFSAFIDSQLRAFTAAWGLPFEYVMAQLTSSNLSASRAALLQFYRTMRRLQDHHIAGVTNAIDLAIIREDIARGRIQLPPGAPADPADLLAGRYQRPPRAMPDPAKEALAAKAWIELGRSPSAIWDEQGWDYTDDLRQSEQDRRLAAERGVQLPGQQPAPRPPLQLVEDDDANAPTGDARDAS